MLYMYFDLDVQIQGPLYHLWCAIEFSSVSIIKHWHCTVSIPIQFHAYMILINESKENNSEATAANEKEWMVMIDVWASIWFVEHIQIQKNKFP